MIAVNSASPALPLSRLLAPERGVSLSSGEDPTVSGLAVDSRSLRRGWAFAACRGASGHGLDYLAAALDAGASAVLWEPDESVDVTEAEKLARRTGVPLVAFPGLQERLGFLACRLYQDPSRSLTVIGVTGTDGKTSVTQFLAQALSASDEPCGVIGTLGYGMHGALAAGVNTTPDAASIQALLAGFRDAGARHACMEVSSHALVQHRVSGVHFQIAVLTNLGRDHLDFHGTEQAYADAKRRLFQVGGLRWAVLNLDDGLGHSLRRQMPEGARVLGYSLSSDSDADVCPTALQLTPDGLAMGVDTPVGTVEVRMPLMGRFNAQNVLAVTGVLVTLGWGASRIADALEALRPVPGRMERFVNQGRPLVVVDYAHTPGALQAALQALGEHIQGRVWCVFGCGGDRDAGKRPLMAAAAEAGSHQVVLTDDNPRGEDPEQIIADIRSGFRRLQPAVERDRPAAIRRAVNEAAGDDVVLVAGKGHEDYQITATGTHHYSDRETVARVLREARP